MQRLTFFCKPAGLKDAISSTNTEFIDFTLYIPKLLLICSTLYNNCNILKRWLCVTCVRNSFLALGRVELSRVDRQERFVAILYKSFACLDYLYVEGREVYVFCLCL